MNKYQMLDSKEVKELAQMLVNEVKNKFKNLDGSKNLYISRVTIDKELLQVLIPVILKLDESILKYIDC